MFENKIYFEAEEDVLLDKSIRPSPSVVNIPKWYKDLNNYINPLLKEKTLKMCMPFLDALSMGYTLKNPMDLDIHQQVINPNFPEEGESMFINHSLNSTAANEFKIIKQVIDRSETHPIVQLGGKEGGCPFVKQNYNEPFIKIINPWIIKVPKGYSVLFLPVINNNSRDWTPIAGVVDCDKFPTTVNFPIIVHKKGSLTIKKGEPIVTAIPFKRENWKAEFRKYNYKELKKAKWIFATTMEYVYKIFWRSKKSWK